MQRPLWASTSTKNPAYSPTLYVDDLIGRDTVNTLAQASIDALHQGDANLRADTVTEDVAGAHAVIAGLAGAGVDFTDVTDTLEREGVASFSTSIHDCFKTLEKSGPSSPDPTCSGRVGEATNRDEVGDEVLEARVGVHAARVRHHVHGPAPERGRLRTRDRRPVDRGPPAAEAR